MKSALMKPAVVWCLLLVCAFVTACSGTSPVPSVPGAAPGASTGMSPDRHKRLGKARLHVRIPHRKRHRRDGHYISPATKSITITINDTTTIANLTPSSPGCSLVDSYTQCSLGVTVPFGTHTFQFVTYDQLGAGGHQLSANTVPFTVSRTSVTTLKVTLGGIAQSISFTPTTEVPQVVASPGGFTMYGKLAHTFTVVPVDADGYSIIGPGAPTVSMTAPPAAQHLGVATPAPTSPNVWSLISSYTATNPLTPLSVTVTAKTTPVPGSGGTTITKTVGFQLYQPWIYVTDLEEGTLYVFDEQGNEITLPANAWVGIPSPTGITYDPNNQQLYIAGQGDSVVYRTNVLGVLFSPPPSPAPWQGVSSPSSTLYLPVSNQILVSNNGYVTGVRQYTEAGLQQTLGADLSGQYATGLAYDPLNQFIYAATEGQGNFPVQAYSTSGNLQTLAGNFTAASEALGIGYDSHNGNLYVGNQNGDFGDVLVFDETGTQITTTGSFAQFGYPTGVIYDPYDGLIYVADGGEPSSVSAFDEQGNPQTGITFNEDFDQAYGIAVVP